MALARSVFERLKSSDGRIRIKTLSGVSALVAVIALLVGVLPVMAEHTGPLVNPERVTYGGGSGACSATIAGRLPSAAGNEFHINNPQPGTYTQDGITVTVRDRTTPLPAGRVFDFEVDGDFVVYDVIVNGGANNNHYDYDGNGGPGAVDHDTGLHAPAKNARSLFNLSHINICYDVPGVTLFACDEPVTLTEPTGLFRIAKATIFANSVVDGECNDKRASFFIDNTDTDSQDPTVTLAFTGDTGQKVVGRLDVEKEFGAPPFEDLTYDRDGSGSNFVPVPWCDIRGWADGDGTEFQTWVTPGIGGSYPELPAVEETACKVAENEDLSGNQFTVVYFEFEDPQFR